MHKKLRNTSNILVYYSTLEIFTRLACSKLAKFASGLGITLKAQIAAPARATVPVTVDTCVSFNFWKRVEVVLAILFLG